jgi:hypothetical protein
MASTTIRISETSRKILNDLSQRDKKSMQAVLEQAIETYRRQRFLKGLSDDFAALRKDGKKWNTELEERHAWDVTLSDGEMK